MKTIDSIMETHENIRRHYEKPETTVISMNGMPMMVTASPGFSPNPAGDDDPVDAPPYDFDEDIDNTPWSNWDNWDNNHRSNRNNLNNKLDDLFFK